MKLKSLKKKKADIIFTRGKQVRWVCRAYLPSYIIIYAMALWSLVGNNHRCFHAYDMHVNIFNVQNETDAQVNGLETCCYS